MTEKLKQEKSLFMTRLMTPDMSNFSGKVHGGTILKLLDEAAFTCASRYCKTYVVTKSLDPVCTNIMSNMSIIYENSTITVLFKTNDFIDIF